MRLTIVGAGGYLGSAVCRAARRANHEVTTASSRDGTGMDPVTGLLGERFRIPPGTDAVLYLAQSPYYRDVPRHVAHLLTVNAVTAVEVARQATVAGVKRFLYASTGTVYAPSFEPLSESSPLHERAWYPWSKIHAERALSLFCPTLDVCALRIFGVYGPGQTDKLVPNLVQRLRAQEEVSLQPRFEADNADPGLRISLCHVDDVSSTILDLLALDATLPAAVNLGADAIDLRTLATELAERLGVTPKFVRATTPRSGDLICDGRLLASLVHPRFRSLGSGLDDVIGATE